MLRRKGKPVFLVANKVDDFNQEAEAAMLWGLGFGQPWPVSALHGRGTADLLDAVMEKMPQYSAFGGVIPRGGPRRIALIGRPNVGKSSLLNKLAGAERVVVDNYAGTPVTRWTNWSSWAGKCGGSWTPPASVAASTWPSVRTTTPHCAPRPPWKRRRSR